MQTLYRDGEHIPLCFEDHPGWEVVKGWHGVEHCQSALCKEYGTDARQVTHITHKYGFWGVSRNEMGDTVQVFNERDEPARGRFKVTLAHVADRHANKGAVPEFASTV